MLLNQDNARNLAQRQGAFAVASLIANAGDIANLAVITQADFGGIAKTQREQFDLPLIAAIKEEVGLIDIGPERKGSESLAVALGQQFLFDIAVKANQDCAEVFADVE